jgi:hypothetical protein
MHSVNAPHAVPSCFFPSCLFLLQQDGCKHGCATTACTATKTHIVRSQSTRCYNLNFVPTGTGSTIQKNGPQEQEKEWKENQRKNNKDATEQFLFIGTNPEENFFSR